MKRSRMFIVSLRGTKSRILALLRVLRTKKHTQRSNNKNVFISILGLISAGHLSLLAGATFRNKG